MDRHSTFLLGTPHSSTSLHGRNSWGIQGIRNHRICVLVIALMTATLTSPYNMWSQQTPQRDTQALTILNQAVAAGGGAALLGPIQDFTGTGTIAYYWSSQVTGSATVKGRGQGQFRIDATLSAGVRTVIANNGAGSITETDGSVELIPYQGAVNLGSMTFPYPLLLNAIQDTSKTIVYVGLTSHLGSQLYDIRIQNTYSAATDPSGLQARQSARDFYIDPNTLLVSSIADVINPAADGSGIPHEVVFANYQTVNGVVAPLWITESVRDQSLMTLQLTQINFNTGLTNADFTQ